MEAYVVGREFPLIASPRDRPWMDGAPSRYAYRCLPLLIANQNGWLICTPEPVGAVWDGGVRMLSAMSAPRGQGRPARVRNPVTTRIWNDRNATI